MAVVDAYIERIEAVNLNINAMVTMTFETARQEAQQATERLERGERVPPLHGVPFTAKDSLDVAGVRSTCGLVSRQDHTPTRDATVVARLREAGAILLGKTNTPDNCFDYETTNTLFGLTKNPWDLRHSVGGSSGGEAALIAAHGSPCGVGSDIAGSIRQPAAFTGIVGLRPTSGTLPEDGQWPPSSGQFARLEALGPMARTVEDVALLYDVLCGVEPAPPDTSTLRGERVAFWFDDGLLPCSNAIKGGIHAAVKALAQAGMRPLADAPPSRTFASVGWGAYLHDTDMHLLARSFGNGTPWSPYTELLRSLWGKPRISSGVLLNWLLLQTLHRRMAHQIDGERWRTELRAELSHLIGEGGVAVCPVFPTTAPTHGWTKQWVSLLSTSSYTTWVNLAGLPGLAVPVGRSGNGLPVGVQIVGMPGTERTLLAAGLAVQQTLAHHATT